MIKPSTRGLLASASLITAFGPAAALAADTAADGAALAAEAAAEQPERDYVGEVILVTGQQDGYSTQDGSTATKTPTPLIDVPQAVATITEDQLDDQAITYLGDALRYVPGVSVATGEGHRDQIIVRGQPTTADFYLDGLRDDAQYYRPTYNVARIEVLKGANALIFGRGGGGGAINRVSKTAQLGERAIALEGALDNWGAFSLAGDLNLPLSDALAGRLNATYEEFGSHRDVYEGRFFGISPTVTARLGEATRLIASYSYEDDDRVVDRGIPALDGGPIRGYDRTFFGDPDFNRATNRLHSARLRLEHDFGGGLSLDATGLFADYDKYYGNVLPGAATATTVSLSGYESATDRRNLVGQANLVWQADFGKVGSTLLAGIEFADQDTGSQRWNAAFAGPTTVALGHTIAVPEVSRGVLTNSSESRLSTFSAYVQQQLDFGLVQLVGGLRYEEFDLSSENLVSGFAAARKDSKVSPRAGVIVKPVEALSFYASYSTSFLPQSGDQFGPLDATTAFLEPEEFENLELGAKWALNPGLLLSAALFRLDRDNTRFTDPLTGVTELTGAARIEGFEISLAGEILPFWHVNFGYTFLDGEVTRATSSAPAGRELQQVPRHQFALWNRYDFTETLGIGLGAIYQGEQFTTLSNAVTLPDYLRVDAAAYYTVNDRISLQLNVENLFDADYYPSAHGDTNIQPGRPLTARLGVRMKL